jgi:serine/threonine protein kinase
LIESLLKSILMSSSELQCLSHIFASSSLVDGQPVALQWCDLKPENLLLDTANRSIRAGDYGALGLVPASGVKKIAATIGSSNYCPPEFNEGCVSNKIDVYAAAKCCIAMFSTCEVGRGNAQLWETPSHIATYLELSQETPIVQLLSNCMRADVSNRFDVEAALAHLQHAGTDDFAIFLCEQVKNNPYDQTISAGALHLRIISQSINVVLSISPSPFTTDTPAVIQSNLVTLGEFHQLRGKDSAPSWMEKHIKDTCQLFFDSYTIQMKDEKMVRLCASTAADVFKLAPENRAAALRQIYIDSKLPKKADKKGPSEAAAFISTVTKIVIDTCLRSENGEVDVRKLEELISAGLAKMPHQAAKFTVAAITDALKPENLKTCLRVWSALPQMNDPTEPLDCSNWNNLCNKRIHVRSRPMEHVCIFLAVAAGLVEVVPNQQKENK